MTVGSADGPLEMPARSADSEWWAAYRILRAEQEEAQDALQEHLRRRNAPSRNIRYSGGPRDGEIDSFSGRLPTSIGANERIDDEIRAAASAYVLTDDRDAQRRAIYRWHAADDSLAGLVEAGDEPGKMEEG